MLASLADSINGVFSFKEYESKTTRHSSCRIDFNFDITYNAKSFEICPERG